jgi:hypothetical protein
MTLPKSRTNVRLRQKYETSLEAGRIRARPNAALRPKALGFIKSQTIIGSEPQSVASTTTRLGDAALVRLTFDACFRCASLASLCSAAWAPNVERAWEGYMILRTLLRYVVEGTMFIHVRWHEKNYL